MQGFSRHAAGAVAFPIRPDLQSSPSARWFPAVAVGTCLHRLPETYQETIHFHETGARKLFWDNGIAQDMTGRRVLSEDYNMSVPWWAEKIGWEAFITCNNAPRWWAVEPVVDQPQLSRFGNGQRPGCGASGGRRSGPRRAGGP
jgi:hypothetical protein